MNLLEIVDREIEAQKEILGRRQVRLAWPDHAARVNAQHNGERAAPGTYYLIGTAGPHAYLYCDDGKYYHIFPSQPKVMRGYTLSSVKFCMSTEHDALVLQNVFPLGTLADAEGWKELIPAIRYAILAPSRYGPKLASLLTSMKKDVAPQRSLVLVPPQPERPMVQPLPVSVPFPTAA